MFTKEQDLILKESLLLDEGIIDKVKKHLDDNEQKRIHSIIDSMIEAIKNSKTESSKIYLSVYEASGGSGINQQTTHVLIEKFKELKDDGRLITSSVYSYSTKKETYDFVVKALKTNSTLRQAMSNYISVHKKYHYNAY